MKVKCEIILPDVSVQPDERIDTYRLTSASILYRYRLYRPSPSDDRVVKAPMGNFAPSRDSGQALIACDNHYFTTLIIN